MFESIWFKLSYKNIQGDYDKISVERVRLFFLNMNYLWGDWICREKLLLK